MILGGFKKLSEPMMDQSSPVFQCFRSRHLLVQIKNGNARTMCEICSQLKKTPKQRQWRRSLVFLVNTE